MGSPIAVLETHIRAKTQQFERKMKKASSTIDKFGARIALAALKAAKFGVGIAKAAIKAAKFGLVIGGAVVAGLILFARQQAKAIDEITKFADRIGASTEGLVGLEHAAALTGNTIQNLRLGLQRMTRRVAEAAQGTGEAQKAIKELGLEAVALNRLSPSQQFTAIAEAMKNVKGSADQVRLSFKLFDAEGVGLLNTLRLGKEGLEAARKEAEALGLTFTRIDAKKVERANDALTKIGAMFKGIARTLTIALAPVVKVVADRFRDLANNGEGIRGVIVGVFEDGAVAAAEMLAVIDKIRAGFNRLHLAQLAIALDNEEFDTRSTDIPSDRVLKLSAKIIALKKENEKLDISAEDRVAKIRAGFALLERQAGGAAILGDLTDATNKLAERTAKIRAGAAERIAASAERVARAAKAAASGTAAFGIGVPHALADPEQIRAANLARWYAAANSARAKLAAQPKLEARAIVGVGGFGLPKKKDVEDDMAGVSDAALDAGHTIAGAFDLATLSTNSFADSIRNAAMELANMLARSQLLRPLGDHLATLFSGAFAGGGVAAGGGGVGSIIGEVTNGSNPAPFPQNTITIAPMVAVPADVINTGIRTSGDTLRLVNNVGHTTSSLAQFRGGV